MVDFRQNTAECEVFQAFRKARQYAHNYAPSLCTLLGLAGASRLAGHRFRTGLTFAAVVGRFDFRVEDDPLPMWVVRVWEPHPPRNTERVEWFLLTNEPVDSLADAMRVIGWYETRWVVEELHKAMKTGCRIEALQFTKTSRLEPMIGVLSTVAVTLLNLRAASRRPDAHTRRATTLISKDYVELLSIWRYGKARGLSVHEFFYALARLGGHQNRRGDKSPGWLILWRGWTTLQAMLDGAETIRRKKCG